MKSSLLLTLPLALSWIAAAAAQDRIETRCDHPAVQAMGGPEAHDACLAVAQAIVSGQPALGLLIGGGSPTVGPPTRPGLAFGLIPRTAAGLRLNVVPLRLPDILAGQIGGPGGALVRRYGAPAPALKGDLSLSLFQGLDFAPGIGGIGGVSVIGSASYLPLTLVTDGFERADLAYGAGGRVHLLRESFVAPGIAASLMWRGMRRVDFGDICPTGIVATTPAPGTPPEVQAGTCTGPGTVGEFSFDLANWSSRLVASKRLLGIGTTIGFGRDSYASDVAFGFRAPDPATGPTPVYRVVDERLTSTRWTIFGNLSYTMLLASLALEAGWQQGTSPVAGFRELGGSFDSRGGTWYSSLGLRVAL
jgi:hypothetical protein